MERIMNRRNVREFIPNDPDDLHCIQACYRMVVHTLEGELLSSEAADRDTGFKPGWPTWQFATLRSLGERGLWVIDCENFSVWDFVEDPERSIEKQVGDPSVAAKVLSDMDTGLEVERLKSCMDHPRVSFVQRAPALGDVAEVLQAGGLPICNVNSKTLAGEEGYMGHFVIVQELDPRTDKVVLQDPGLPPLRDYSVSVERFRTAWMYPGPDMANFYAVFPDAGGAMKVYSSLQQD